MVSKTVLFVELRKIQEEMDLLEEDDSAIEEAKKLVAPEHHEAFEEFLRHMEADIDFLTYWEQDENCQKAVRQAADSKIKLMETFMQRLKVLVA